MRNPSAKTQCKFCIFMHTSIFGIFFAYFSIFFAYFAYRVFNFCIFFAYALHIYCQSTDPRTEISSQSRRRRGGQANFKLNFKMRPAAAAGAGRRRRVAAHAKSISKVPSENFANICILIFLAFFLHIFQYILHILHIGSYAMRKSFQSLFWKSKSI